MATKRQRELEAKLRPIQRKAALLCVEKELSDSVRAPDGEQIRWQDVADEIGYSAKELWWWRTRNPVFIEYMNLLADDFLRSKQARVYRRLLQLIDPAGGQTPSVKAIDMYLRMQGKFKDHQIVETRNGDGAGASSDIAADIEELDALLEESDSAAESEEAES